MTQKQCGSVPSRNIRSLPGSRFSVWPPSGKHLLNAGCQRLGGFFVGTTIKIVSSPAMLPMASGQSSPSSAAATGCALPTVVLITSRFCAARTSSTNSRTSRETGGNAGSEECSPRQARIPRPSSPGRVREYRAKASPALLSSRACSALAAGLPGCHRPCSSSSRIAFCRNGLLMNDYSLR